MKDLTSIFKTQTNEIEVVNKNDTEETQKKTLQKRLTLQSLSAKETINAKSSAGGFDDDDDDDDIHFGGTQDMKN